jgi:dienelactone hydrolase
VQRIGPLVLIAVGLAPALATAEGSVETLVTSDGVSFAIRDKSDGRPAPTLLVFALGAEQTLASDDYNKIGRLLGEAGWQSVAIDAPAHGADVRTGEQPASLTAWRARLEAREPVVEEFCRRASAVLDWLIDQGLTDPHRIAACGTSRGGFLALHFAAADRRVGAVAAFAPVTELAALREFAGLESDPRVLSQDLTHQAFALSGRPVWLTIGNQDDRVGTDRCIALEQRLVAEARARGHAPPVELHLSATEGHRIYDRAHDDAAAWIARVLPADAAAVETIGDRACLLLDDRYVAHRRGLHRTWHAAQPAAEPALVAEEPWEAWPHMFGTVLYDPADKLYKMWYENYGGRSDAINTSYAESDDGRTWRKPRLGLWEFQGSKENNIVVPQGELACVFLDPRDDDPAGRLKMFVHCSYAGGELGQGFVLLRSADGRHWEHVGPGFSPGYVFAEQGNFSDSNVPNWDPLAGRYLADWRTFAFSPVAENKTTHARRAIGISRSDRLAEGWSPTVMALRADGLDDAAVALLGTDPAQPDWAEMYVMPHWTCGNHYLGLVSLLHFIDSSDVRGGGDVQLAFSHDGLAWQRPRPRAPAIAPSSAAGMFPTYAACGGPLEVGDELWLYYTEANGAHPLAPFSEARSQIRAAVWRKDGFASLDTVPGGEGELLTVPLSVGGTGLYLNGTARAGGTIRVELQAADGTPLPGYELDACDPLTGDFTAARVSWRGRDELPMQSEPARLRITVTDGSVYSFRFGE